TFFAGAMETATAPGARPSRPHQSDDRSHTSFDHANPAAQDSPEPQVLGNFQPILHLRKLRPSKRRNPPTDPAERDGYG
ncbi:MAG: hypothetical protein QHJ82_15205, partial [Verrucomicrobiota bacterium]|nr:hypothetical protein [Verrucomicrobiota bacterium]